MSRLVSTEYLANNIQRQDIKVIDGSWHLPIFKRNARKEYEEKHIPFVSWSCW
ncbi:hypothetical protein BKA69DRAFT_1046002 [Paraphysoderma sedebokerense]|nr:hypothetical protein BKA69DRAFT_1046002 [Paraphysoderma sedebokerense]